MDDVATPSLADAKDVRVGLLASRLAVVLAGALAVGVQKLALPEFVELAEGGGWHCPAVVYIAMRLHHTHVVWQLLVGFLVLRFLYPRRLNPLRESALNMIFVALILIAIGGIIFGMLGLRSWTGLINQMGK